MLKEFREFVNRGSMIDLAVGVVLGAAFTKVVDAIVNHLLSPLLGIFGGANFDNLFVVLREGKTPGPYNSLEAAKGAGAVYLGYGALLTAMIQFLIVGFALFLIVKAINRTREVALRKAAAEPQAAPEVPADIALLTEIRDLLKTKAPEA